jgi:glycine betaine/proline transport system permease protein
MEHVLTTAPWWLVVAVVAGIALILSGRRAAIFAAGSLVAIVLLQSWEDAMTTTVQVLAAVLITMVVGITMGVAAARNARISQVLRPINDAAQTMPSFVYLIPAVFLFGPTRFSAILAAFVYAIPVVIRLVEDGIRAVSPTVVEAATAAGSTRLQMIFKVQLPMARRSLLVATNQGIVMVLAMVVVGGLVGGGGLGYDVVAGLSQGPKFGLGMAAALSIVMLGVALDRTMQGAAGGRKYAGDAA